MAFAPQSLVRVATVPVAAGQVASDYFYATADAPAAVEAAGYFADARLAKGDTVAIVSAIKGTPVLKGYLVTATVAGIAAIALAGSAAEVANVYGRTGANLSSWLAALARVKGGIGRARVLFVGDSKAAGAGAGTGSKLTDGAEPLSKPSRLASILTARGIPAARNSWMGTKGLASLAELKAYDTRLSGMTTDWGGGEINSLGGVSLSAGASPDNMVFTPAGPVDTYEVYTLNFGGQGSGPLTLDASGTVIATIDSGAGPVGFTRTVATFGRGAHALNLKRTANGFMRVQGGIAYDSTVPAVDIVNAGVYGSTVDFHTVAGNSGQAGGGVFAAENCLAVVAPHLVLIQLTTNDLNAGTALATWSAGIQSIVGKAKAAGASVVLENATYAASGYGTPEQRAAYRDELIRLGQVNGCMVVDHAGRFPAPDLADGVHETAAQYAAEASFLAEALLL